MSGHIDARMVRFVAETGDGRDNLRALWHRATVEQKDAGMVWYRAAGNLCAEFARSLGVTTATFTAVVAALSPQVKWEVNIPLAVQVVGLWRGGFEFPAYHDGAKVKHLSAGMAPTGVKAYPQSVLKAFWILDGADPGTILGSVKTGCFYRNLMGEWDQVTVDSHAIQGWLNGVHCLPGTWAIADAVYPIIAADYAAVAAEFGVTPAEFQAVVWLAKKAITD